MGRLGQFASDAGYVLRRLTWPTRRAFREWAHRRSVAGCRAHGGEYGGWGLALVCDCLSPGFQVHLYPPNDRRRPLPPADARRYAAEIAKAADRAEWLNKKRDAQALPEVA